LIVTTAEEKDAKEKGQNKLTPFPAAVGGVREGVGGGLSMKSELLS
jgi:hypothetical protein